ncbi:Aste57867_25477 [Aphanomyces stellatus]|uniref:Aste57867_25477 protein n=1 Tax=Aphanomyces stellatus TaxID=120398 RepID=A0A485LUK5_9STRA|nr:hypothetical protein As57867_025398 [Aphanomyces stellatus]VFU02100.1 Aste57867_25477 [Aphanomyces stellatus]
MHTLWFTAVVVAAACACRDVTDMAITKTSPAKWVWMGALTSSSIRIRASTAFQDPACDPAKVSLYVHPSPAPESGETHGRRVAGMRQQMNPTTTLHDFQAHDLVPGNNVAFDIRYDNSPIWTPKTTRHVQLPPPKGTPFSFQFAFSSCADEDSDPEVFHDIRRQDPLFFVHMGDLHYANLEVNDVGAFRGAYESMFASPAGQAMLGMELPMAYMWDDHDYGPDNSDATAPGRNASLQAYREYTPHYPLQNPYVRVVSRESEHASEDLMNAIQQTFTIGRVHFIMTDLRSQRTPNLDQDVPTKTILGPAQKQWFKDELRRASTSPDIALIVWVNTMPWHDDERKWGHFTHEQAEVVAVVRDLDTAAVPLVIISGDAHMLAVDDGTHSPGGLPVFHAAALGRPGSIKGGPYSHGAFPGSGQFGIMRVSDDGQRVCLHFSGRRGVDQVIAYDTCDPASTPGEPYIPPSKIVRVATRMWKKTLSRLETRWKKVKFQSVALFLALLLGVTAVSVVVRRMQPRAKRD